MHTGNIPLLLKRAYLPILVLSSILGCAGPQSRPADVIIHDAHSGGSALAIDPHSQILASGDWDGRLRLWWLNGGKPVAGWRAHRGTVNGIHFLKEGQRLITAGYDGRVDEWDLEGRMKREWQTPSPIRHMVVREGADRLVTGHEDGAVRLWQLSSGALLGEWRLFPWHVQAVALDQAGRRIAASGSQGALAYWVVDGKPRYFGSSRNSSATLAFAPDGRHLYGAGWFYLYRWNLQSGELEEIRTEHGGRINSIAFMPDGRRLASISRQTDSAVLILDPQTGKTLQRMQKHDLCGAVVTVSPRGRFLATTSDDASVRIWDLSKGNSHGKSAD
jgi:WD40 repeat protein